MCVTAAPPVETMRMLFSPRCRRLRPHQCVESAPRPTSLLYAPGATQIVASGVAALYMAWIVALAFSGDEPSFASSPRAAST